jgi:hypothetical protein
VLDGGERIREGEAKCPVGVAAGGREIQACKGLHGASEQLLGLGRLPRRPTAASGRRRAIPRAREPVAVEVVRIKLREPFHLLVGDAGADRVGMGVERSALLGASSRD